MFLGPAIPMLVCMIVDMILVETMISCRFSSKGPKPFSAGRRFSDASNEWPSDFGRPDGLYEKLQPRTPGGVKGW